MHHPTGRDFRYVQNTHADVNTQAFIIEGNLRKLRLGTVGESLPEKAVQSHILSKASLEMHKPTQTPL